MPEQGDRSLYPLFPVKRQRRSCRCRQLHSRPENDTGHRLASIPPLPPFGILSDCKGLHQNLQRQDIPEPQTDIPPRKHSLLAGNQGCVLDPTPVKPRIQIKNKGKPRYETSPCFFWYIKNHLDLRKSVTLFAVGGSITFVNKSGNCSFQTCSCQTSYCTFSPLMLQ